MQNRNVTLAAASVSDLARALIERSEGSCAAVQTLADTLRKLAVEDFGECPVQLKIAAKLAEVAWDLREEEEATF